ncbi:MAG: hypothetical protein ACQSGP_10900 [Frankia sp.]
MYKQLAIGAVAIASLAACGSSGGSSAGSTGVSTGSSAIYPSASAASAYAAANQSPTLVAENSPTYVSRFRQEFPQLAQGKTDAQIASDGTADCSDMADNWKITTPSMARRYGLGNSTADQFVLHNVALLDMFTICPTR